MLLPAIAVASTSVLAAGVWLAIGLTTADPPPNACPSVGVVSDAVNANDSAVAPAAGPIRWTTTELPAADAGQLNAELIAVTPFRAGWVAVGNESFGAESRVVVLRSDNGRRWERVAEDDPALQRGWVHDVVAGGPGLVAIGSLSTDDRGGSASAIWTSTDGASWVLADTLAGANPSGVAASPDGRVVAVGDGGDGQGLVWLSDDGDAWERIDLTSGGGSLRFTATDVLAFDGGWRAVGRLGADLTSGPALLSSEDGRTWACASLPAPDWDLVSATTLYRAGDALLVLGDGSPSCAAAASCVGQILAWATEDGATWSVDADGGGPVSAGGFASLGSDGIGFMAVGHEMAWLSTDGRRWWSLAVDDRAGTLANAQPAAVAWADGRLVAVGTSFPLDGSARAWVAYGEWRGASGR